jgi:hypothetical protein
LASSDNAVSLNDSAEINETKYRQFRPTLGGLRASIRCAIHLRQGRPARRQPIDVVFPDEAVFVLGHNVLYQNGAILFSKNFGFGVSQHGAVL